MGSPSRSAMRNQVDVLVETSKVDAVRDPSSGERMSLDEIQRQLAVLWRRLHAEG